MKEALRALFPACVIKENTLFCITDCEHIFEKIDIKNGEIKYIDNPKGYTPEKWVGTDTILLGDEEIYFIEQNGERIMKYFPHDDLCEYIDLMCNDYVCSNFAGITIYRNKMYLFPKYRDNVFKLDLDIGVVKEMGCLCPEVNYRFNEKEEIPHMLFSCSYQIESHMWVFSERNQFVIDYNMELEKFKKYILPNNIKSCELVEYKEGLFYILTMEGKLFLWSPDENIEQEIYDFGIERKYPYFGAMVFGGNKLWLLPLWGKDIIIIDIVNKNSRLYQKYPIDFYYCAPENWAKYLSYCSDEEYIYFAMHSGNYILSISRSDGSERWIRPIGVGWKRKKEFYLKNIQKQLNYENQYFDVFYYIRILEQSAKKSRKYHGIGKTVWNIFGGK